MAPRKGSIAAKVGRLRETQQKGVSQFVEAVAADRGCGTPFEEFLSLLASCYEPGFYPTPEIVAEHLEEFKENFELAIKDARHILRQYASLVVAGERLAPGPQEKALKDMFGPSQRDQASQLDVIRTAIRSFPDLLFCDEMPEPWKSELAKPAPAQLPAGKLQISGKPGEAEKKESA